MLAEAEVKAEATIRLDIDGMHCASCVSRIERRLNKLPGVDTSSVNLANNTATVVYDPLLESQSTIIDAIVKSGYSASVKDDFVVSPVKQKPKNTEVIVALVLAAIVMALSMTGPVNRTVGWTAALISGIVVFFLGRHIFRGAWIAFAHGQSATMDTLIAVGSASAYLLSLYELIFFARPNVYFDTASTIVALILFGRHLETAARQSTGVSLESLASLTPVTTTVIDLDGNEAIAKTTAVMPGDLLRVKPGEKFAVDGVIISGTSSADESLMTGESKAVDKSPGAKVIGGSVNVDGTVIYRATAVGSSTVMASIVRLVQEAQGSKPKIQKLADLVASVFVPTVIAIAAATLLVRLFALHETLAHSLIPSVAVMVIACPCALGLATPTAIMVGIGRAARLGILIRNGQVLENAEKLSTVIFDKTGTLTNGKLSMESFYCEPHQDDNEILHLAASAESVSEHPAAQAIVDRARSVGLKLSIPAQFVSRAGLGIEALIEGRSIVIGKPSFVTEKTEEVPEWSKEHLQKMTDSDDTFLLISVDSRLMAIISLSDGIRADAAAAVDALRKERIETALLSGDRMQAVKACAESLGIRKFYGELLPSQKSELVKNWKRSPQRTIAFVGDGVNDAPALAAADIGFAMGHATDIAMNSADVTLINNGLYAVCSTIDLSKATIRIIKQNLMWAFMFNIIGIPMAATGLLNPMIAASAMALSSIAVVFNSLRLRSIDLPQSHRPA